MNPGFAGHKERKRAAWQRFVEPKKLGCDLERE